jgi:hypothetical protein
VDLEDPVHLGDPVDQLNPEHLEDLVDQILLGTLALLAILVDQLILERLVNLVDQLDPDCPDNLGHLVDLGHLAIPVDHLILEHLVDLVRLAILERLVDPVRLVHPIHHHSTFFLRVQCYHRLDKIHLGLQRLNLAQQTVNLGIHI